MATTMERMRARPEAEFLTLEAAAEWYDMAKSTLRKMATEGALKKYWRKRDKRLWLSVEELEQELRPRSGEERRDG
jgi:hypothetical protein